MKITLQSLVVEKVNLLWAQPRLSCCIGACLWWSKYRRIRWRATKLAALMVRGLIAVLDRSDLTSRFFELMDLPNRTFSRTRYSSLMHAAAVATLGGIRADFLMSPVTRPCHSTPSKGNARFSAVFKVAVACRGGGEGVRG